MNLDVISMLAAPVLQDLDLAGYADALAGKVLKVRVNPPAFVDEIVRKREENVSLPREAVVNAVWLFVGENDTSTLEAITNWEDNLLFWVFNEATTRYTEYLKGLRKN